MRSLTPLVFVLAILTSHVSTHAADPVPPSIGATLVSATDVSVGTANRAPAQQYGPNGYDQYRRQPNLGSPQSPSSGFKHFPFSMHMFTTWYRPKAATLTKAQRCAPDDFRPRGYGNLFARPYDPYRMEYTPHILTEDGSSYGPAYLYREPDQRCEKRCCCGHCQDCQSCQNCQSCQY